jgi:hypothetical protein
MSQNSINFFGWIREGVKQSVLLGVSDAIETIGTPADTGNMHPSLAALLKAPKQESLTGPLTAKASPLASSKKRLGRSLRDIEPNNLPPGHQGS